MRGATPLFWVDAKCNTEQQSPYLSGFMDTRSVGLKEILGKELQIVLEGMASLDLEYIIGDIGARALDGENMQQGVKLTGYIPNYPSYPIMLEDIAEDNTLRIVFPDRNGHLPEDEDCEYPFNLQSASISMLQGVNGEFS